MSRPHSILGLLFHLLGLYARRIPRRAIVLVAIAAAIVAWTRRSEHHVAARGALQAGVLRDGFVITHVANGRRIVEVDARGTKRREVTFGVDGDVRIVGASNGTLAGWQEGSKVRLARIDNRNDASTWGKSARRLCDGVASNEYRFGVSWLEADNSVWVVSGPVGAQTLSADLDVASLPADVDWCGVTSAEKNVALVWRYRDSLRFTTCTAKKCQGLPTSIKFDQKRAVLGFGCLRNACLIASRDPNGTAQLAYVVESGKVKWQRPIITEQSSVSIIGVGNDAFAVGVARRDGAYVVKLDRTGRETAVWNDPASLDVPELAWSSGQLLVAHFHGDVVAPELVPLPR